MSEPDSYIANKHHSREETFDVLLIPALFENRKLDFDWRKESNRKDPLAIGPNWKIKSRSGIEELWHACLVYRVQNEVNPEMGNYVETRWITNEVHALADDLELELPQIIEALCW